MIPALPRLLIIDDLFGRDVPNGPNRERANLCGKFLLEEEESKNAAGKAIFEILKPAARVRFCRGQTPTVSDVGMVVENDLQSALSQVRAGWIGQSGHDRAPWSMVLLDLCFYTGEVTEESNRRTAGMPVGRPEDEDPRSYFGLTLLDAIHREFPELPVMILSSKPREEVSLEFSERGALGFISRDDIRGPELLAEALWLHGLLPDPTGTVIGHSLPVLLALREARRAARHRQNVLIRGERGSGKELLADYLHRMSRRNEERPLAPFVAVNSAAFAQNLFASELFGIEPKTATNVDGKIGLIESAHGGDLFLDEIADMPGDVQAAMLRVLQERQITRVGGRKTTPVDVRFLSATNADLEDPNLGFRPDLLDRLCLGGTVWLPPLRDRRADIPLLAESFVREAEALHPGTRRRQITPDAMEVLLGHAWPGNIRELRSVIFSAINRHTDVEHLVASHLRIGSGGARTVKRKAGMEANRKSGLETLLSHLAETGFEIREVGQWAGTLGKLQREHSLLTARLLEAALEITKRRTPENPEGAIQIHPAIKLITGDSSLTASKAADLIKRLLSPLEKELAGDLRDAYEISVRLRPRSVPNKRANRLPA